MIVTFCGHSEVHFANKIEDWLEEVLEQLIKEGVREFYLGGYGGFDRLVFSVLKRKKVQYENIRFLLIMPYLNHKLDPSEYVGTIYPPLEKVPKKYANIKRNEWMVKKADVLVAYVIHDWGGAAKTMKDALQRNKKIVQY